MMFCSQDKGDAPSVIAQSLSQCWWSPWECQGKKRHWIFLTTPWTLLSTQKSSNGDFHTEIANQRLKNFSCSWNKSISFFSPLIQTDLKAACSIKSPKCTPECMPRPFKPWGGMKDNVLIMWCIRGAIHKIFILKQKMCLSALFIYKIIV